MMYIKCNLILNNIYMLLITMSLDVFRIHLEMFYILSIKVLKYINNKSRILKNSALL